MNGQSLDFGVCRLSVVSVRTAPDHKAEQHSQLLFGDHYEVFELSKDSLWLRVASYYDQCEGWIHQLHHHPISKEYYDYINRADFKISTDLSTSILYNKSPLLILMGSIIPISGAELFKMEEQFAFNGDSKSLGQKRDVEYLEQIARKYLNVPFQWGGKNPFGIDASGFTQMVFKINGYRLGRTIQEQMRQGKEVRSWAEAQSGDLAFFKSRDGNLHTGIILHDEKIIHSSGKVRIDYLNEEGILHGESKIYTHSLTAIRRILADS